ncbi:hypothetical protein ABL78_5500 [Leptomonas seymouri]|uniref:Uncharacterized protein n=1 Tax=Leptomonas seymouri TaxID=5684 RepID=A0A0N0P4L8_LEPSE|nr:hypothetical protein ABL78_5500 [Leptomonas seymouri]|eukprot:KPI85446.1 hypothetical protein ABL78_5500 [Leptomonas seymouri]
MLNTPAAWEAMKSADAQARLARLHRCASALQNVYAAFTPWQHLSTGIAELDALLNAAGVGSGDGGGSPHITDIGGSMCHVGGLPAGGLHEFYGPPLSGKSFLLRCIATTFARRMTAFRQWCLDELVRDQTWLAASSTDSEGMASGGYVSEGVSPHDAVCAPTVAVYDWDLYICLVRGTSLPTDNPSSVPFSSAEVLSWQKNIIDAFPAPPLFRDSVEGKTHSEYGVGTLHTLSQQQLQRDYVADHCQVCVASTPNELLTFLNGLLTTDDSPQKVSHPHASECTAIPSSPSPQQEASTTESPDCARSATTEKRTRKRSRSGGTDKFKGAPPPSPPPSSAPSPPASASKRVWDLQKQRLLLVDGLDQLWLHPVFGTHCGTHSGQWFAVELHRLLRCFLTPQCLRAPASPAEGSGHSNPLACRSFSVHSTVVVTNGSQGGSFGLHTPQQLQDRLHSSPATTRTAFPRPAGNLVWLMATDTRCLVEPAHPGLVSFPLSTPSSLGAASSTKEDAHTTSAPLWAHGHEAGLPFFVRVSRAAKTTVEARVTVVQGGSRVCGGWVERRADEEDETGEN